MTYDRNRQSGNDDLGDTDTGTQVGDTDSDMDSDINASRRVSGWFGSHTPLDPDSDVDIDTDIVDTDIVDTGSGQV